VAYVNGAAIVAGLIGLMTGSWPVFLFVLAGLTAGQLAIGNIRLSRRRR
jgi:hypothetical protein